MKSIKMKCIAVCLAVTGLMVSSCGDQTGTTPDNPTVNNSIFDNGNTKVVVYDITPEPSAANINNTTGDMGTTTTAPTGTTTSTDASSGTTGTTTTTDASDGTTGTTTNSSMGTTTGSSQ